MTGLPGGYTGISTGFPLLTWVSIIGVKQHYQDINNENG